MSAEWVTAIATVGTFVVIAASAGAALFQLRHMRSGNESALVKHHTIDEKLFCDLFSPSVVAAWGYLETFIANRRLILGICLRHWEPENVPFAYLGAEYVKS